MNLILRIFVLSVLTLAALPSRGHAAQMDRHVVLISLDGMAHYYFDDPKAKLPVLRQMAKEGARMKRMIASFPTVTWPNHTTLVTGVSPARHGVISNVVFNRKTLQNDTYLCDPLYDMSAIVKVPTVFDVASAAGMKTAGVCWPATRNAKTLTWMVPDIMDQDLFERFSTSTLLTEIRLAGIPYERQAEWCKARTAGNPQRDYMYTQIARQIILRHKPNLTLVHLMGGDSFQHATGRQSPEAYYAVNDYDRHVGEIVDAVKEAGIMDKTTFIVTADHGFRTFAKQILPNVVLGKNGLIGKMVGKEPQRRAWCLQEGGSAFIYILDEANRAQILADIRPKLAAMEGVDWVRGPEEFAALGFPTPDKDSRAPDLLMSAKDGYAFAETALGDAEVVEVNPPRGAHGYDPAVPDMRAIFVAYGAGIKPGLLLDEIRNVDVAPTIAKILGLDMKDMEGRVLDEIFK
jgi:predicted AlkP superfamily pyrophosphatase or phosphodiesterase